MTIASAAALALALIGQDPAPPTAAAPGRPDMDPRIFARVRENWNVHCSLPGAATMRIAIDIEINAEGRIVGDPALVEPSSDPGYRAAAAGALRALRLTEPFDVPEGFRGGRYRPTFIMARVCADEP